MVRAEADPDGGSVGEWLGVRRVLSAHRHTLSGVAAGLYPQAGRAGSSWLLCRGDWLPREPVSLDDVELRWRQDAAAPLADGTGAGSDRVRPWAPGGGRYPAYSAAVADLDRPALFEDRACYRLLDVSRGDGARSPAGGRPAMTFGRTGYFEGIDVGHAVAHELAAAWQASPGGLTLADLPLRAAAGDPCELARRPSLSAVITLTLRRAPSGEASFLLHWRDPAQVNHAGGMYQVMPAGIFQPLQDTPASWRADFSLWRSLVREFSEEFLGTSEEYVTSGGVLDYGGWPFHQRLTAARSAGTLRVWWLGAGVDPLTLATDILTVAVFDAGEFDSVFARMVDVNAEGRVVAGSDLVGTGPGGAGAVVSGPTRGGSVGIPFTAETVARLTGGGEPMQPSGAGLLQLAWRHRRHLLG